MSKPALTFHQCGPRPGDAHPEDWMLVGLVNDGTEQREAIEAADKRERLRCDCCQAYQDSPDDLLQSGGDMICDDCAGNVERSDDR